MADAEAVVGYLQAELADLARKYAIAAAERDEAVTEARKLATRNRTLAQELIDARAALTALGAYPSGDQSPPDPQEQPHGE